MLFSKSSLCITIDLSPMHCPSNMTSSNYISNVENILYFCSSVSRIGMTGVNYFKQGKHERNKREEK